MNEGVSRRLSRRSVHDLANELIELIAEEFDALNQGLTEVEFEQYLEVRRRTHLLLTALRDKVSRPS
jgi:ElaB/YqjD/DUF883 family membrane-anchored ribosome-binding protein